MKKILITYADNSMSLAKELCCKSALSMGFDYAEGMCDINIDAQFTKFNQEIFKQKRGAGYWLWKPYILLKTMLQWSDDTVIVYSDAGVEWLNNPNYIIDRMTDDVWIFGNQYQHSHWCKRDVFIKMHCDYPHIHESKQAQASVIFFKNTPFARHFVKEWLCWCMMPGMIDDSPSVAPPLPEFAENRHDQAILTNMALMYGMKLHYWPASYNNGQFLYPCKEFYPNDNYPVIFNHHRKRNDEI